MTTSHEQFIPVAALGDGFAPGAHVLDPSDGLRGATLTIEFGRETVELEIGDQRAGWTGAEAATDVPVRITSVRPGVYFVDRAITEDEGRVASLTFVVDVERGQATRVIGHLPTAAEAAESAYTRVRRGDEPTLVTARVDHGTVVAPAPSSPGQAHQPTDELVGLRNRYTYSPNEQYEHVYFTPTLYAWHCIKGVERDLADVDACRAYKIRGDLYLFPWREKIVPTLGLILIDLQQMRTDGKIYGFGGFDGATVANFPVGALAEILNRTEHETGE
ncbi:MoaF C-terminal domain-containing protein [Tsukamurella soli]|uniref:Molybdenum cofactor biosynthesis F family protein n=1 Tax=Tsukamurella soli TaxID=644556 RepID=A0ABP8J365_9ACTN